MDLKQFRFPDWITILSGIVTIIGAVFGGFAILYKPISIELWIAILYLCIVCSIFIATNIIGAILLHRMTFDLKNAELNYSRLNARLIRRRKNNIEFQDKQKAFADLFRLLSSDFSVYEMYLNEIACDYSKLIDRFNSEEFHGKTAFYLENICSNIAELFKLLTGEQCAVCIKARSHAPSDGGASPPSYFSSPENRLDHVATIWRDRTSAGTRTYDAQPMLKFYRHDDNTAFSQLISTPNDFFGCDDLKALGNGYRNINPDWGKHYNAVAVHAIKNPRSTTEGTNDIIGFLCVDNFHGNLNTPISEGVLGIISYLLYNFLQRAWEIHIETAAKGDLKDDLRRIRGIS